MRFLAAFAAAGLLLSMAPPSPAQAPAAPVEAQEHEVKAAFLSKFPAFVEWPSRPAPEVPFVIAVAGAEDVAGELRRLTEGRRHEGRVIEIREVADAQGAMGGHMVFVGRAATARLPGIVRGLSGRAVLLVSEAPGALEQGSMVNFVVSDARVRFDVALDNAEAARLRISARLLAVARSVRGARQ
jgi:hypothetical protein